MNQKAKQQPGPSPARSTFREYLEALLIAAIFLGFANTFVVKTFYIPSASMEETLLIGDHLFVNRFIFGRNGDGPLASLMPSRGVQRGDIVIFRSVEDPRVDMVKRCIGVPGDTIEIRDKQLFVNGLEVDDDSYAVHQDPSTYRNRPGMPRQQRIRDNFGPYTVPPDSYFCMGDNRDRSYDSRYWGTVPAHYVKGRALMIYWSYGGEVSDGSWHGLGNKLAQLVSTATGFFTRTRWSRSFQIIR
jgi:signal peptidase I